MSAKLKIDHSNFLITRKIYCLIEMSSADKSASGYTRRLKARTLAVFHQNNPTVNDFGGSAKPSNAITELLRNVGTFYGPNATCNTCAELTCENVCDFELAIVFPVGVDDREDFQTTISEAIGESYTIPEPPDGYSLDYFLFLWFPSICNSTNYNVSIILDGSNIPASISSSGPYNTPAGEFFFDQSYFYVIYPSQDVSEGELSIEITASNECSSSSTIAEFGCFLENAPVTLSDGSKKAIQDIAVGDLVMGAFGEVNPVLALHRPLLGAGKMVRINNEHSTTSHHPHIAADKQIYCIDPKRITAMTYGKNHTVILGDGSKALRKMEGFAFGRVKKLELGVALQTSTGARLVSSMEDVPMSPFTQVYHLVVGGSHTYIVEDYAVSAWPREDDFNYDAWVPR
jgi:hypothetical protein